MAPVGSFRGVRPSKFRHLVGIASKTEKCYQTSDQRTIHQASDASNTVDVNPKFLALVVEVAGGGAFVVVPLEKWLTDCMQPLCGCQVDCMVQLYSGTKTVYSKKVGRVHPSSPRVVGHRGPVTALRWCPHNDNLIASASDDATIRLWHIPDGGIRENTTTPQCVLEGHSRRVTLLFWHPTADGVLLSAGLDKMVYVWDTNTGLCMLSLDCHPDVITSMSLNRQGSLLATTCKDRKLRVIDPRTQAVLQETVCHEGAKSCQAVYLGDTHRIATVGFGQHSERQLAVWDDGDLARGTPLRRETIDSASGVLVPFYDHDTGLLFVAGKGDGNIRFYEMTEEAPYFHYLNQYISGEPQRGLGVMCKRGCRVMDCEVLVFYKLHATRPLCQPISMVVPRKSGQFQQDLFPDTAAPVPAVSAHHWLAGVNAPPITMPLSTGVTVKTHRPVPARPVDVAADKNADKKFRFLSNQTRADYRPLQGEAGEEVAKVTTSEKDIKTSCNLDTKFQALQRMWGSSGPDNDIPMDNLTNQQQQPPKPQHTAQYQQEQLINKQNQLQQQQLQQQQHSNVLAAIRKLETPPGTQKLSGHAEHMLRSSQLFDADYFKKCQSLRSEDAIGPPTTNKKERRAQKSDVVNAATTNKKEPHVQKSDAVVALTANQKEPYAPKSDAVDATTANQRRTPRLSNSAAKDAADASVTEKMLQEVLMEKPTVPSETELRLAYVSQCAELKLLRRQLLAKDRQIRELQLLLDQRNRPASASKGKALLN